MLAVLIGLLPRPWLTFNWFFYFYNDYLIALNPDRLLFAGLSRWLSKNPLKALSFIYSESLFDFLFLSFCWGYSSYSSLSYYLIFWGGFYFYFSLVTDSYFFLSYLLFYLLLIEEFCVLYFYLSFDGSFLSFVVDLLTLEV